MELRILLPLLTIGLCALVGRTAHTDVPKSAHSDSMDLLIPPIELDSMEDHNFSHDVRAHFHAHGEQICASGCAASRHPTPLLSSSEFTRLRDSAARSPLTADNQAYESLLFYGRQSLRLLNQYGAGPLNTAAESTLRRQLARTHAVISIRVIDERGDLRTWLSETRVPLDRRHEFTMQTKRLPDLVTSGTIKRVGQDHLWTRL